VRTFPARTYFARALATPEFFKDLPWSSQSSSRTYPGRPRVLQGPTLVVPEFFKDLPWSSQSSARTYPGRTTSLQGPTLVVPESCKGLPWSLHIPAKDLPCKDLVSSNSCENLPWSFAWVSLGGWHPPARAWECPAQHRTGQCVSRRPGA